MAASKTAKRRAAKQAKRPLQPHLPQERTEAPQVRIAWTDDEQNALAVAMACYLLKHPGTTLPQTYLAVRDHALAQDRQRNGMTTAGAFKRLLPRIIEEMNAKAVPPPPAIKVIEVEVEHVRPISEYAESELRAELYRRDMEPMLDELAKGVAARVTSAVLRGLIERDEDAALATGPRLRRYTVVGLLPEQAEVVANTFAGIVDLRFWKNEGMSKLKGAIRWADRTLIMTRWVNHAQTEQARKYANAYTRVPGHVNDLIEILEGLIFEESAGSEDRKVAT